MTQKDINELRNTLANAYSSLDSYLKEEGHTASEVQLMTAKVLTVAIEKAFEIPADNDTEHN